MPCILPAACLDYCNSLTSSAPATVPRPARRHTHTPADLITTPTQHKPRQYNHRKQAATVPVARRRIAAARNPPTRARSGGKKSAGMILPSSLLPLPLQAGPLKSS